MNRYTKYIVSLLPGLVLLSCVASRPHTDPQKLVVEAIAKRYAGQFRTDSVFLERLRSFEHTDNMGTMDDVLWHLIEWYLLRNDTFQAKIYLDQANLKFKDESPYYNWLWALYLVTIQEENVAVHYLQDLISDHPKNPGLMLRIYWLLATIDEQRGDRSKALEQYLQAIQFGPIIDHNDYYVESLMHAGNVYFSSDSIQTAQQYYELGLGQAISLNVSRLVAFGYYHLGKVEEHLGNSNAAVAQYKLGLQSTKTLGASGLFVKKLLADKIGMLE